MDLWNSFVTWLTAAETRPLIFACAVLFVSILVSTVIAAFVSRGALKGITAQREREQRASAVATLVDTSTEAAVWNSLTAPEQTLVDRAIGQADIYVRLLPVAGARLAADWASHQLGELKRHSSTYGSDLGPVVREFSDRLLEWDAKPRRAKRIFQDDLERWRIDHTGTSAVTPATSVFPASGASSDSTDDINSIVATDAAAPQRAWNPDRAETERVSAPAVSPESPSATTSAEHGNSDSDPSTTEAPNGQHADSASAANPQFDPEATQAISQAGTTESVLTNDSPEKLLDDIAAIENDLPKRSDTGKPDPL